MSLDSGSDILSQREFFALVEQALPDGCVDLGGQRVELLEPLTVGGSSRIRISNGIVSGSGHSLFQVSLNRAGLFELSDLTLLHWPSPERAAKRSLGSALFVRGKSSVALHRCEITSQAGFGVWLVQKASALLCDCTLPGCGRSSVVAFDQSRVECDGTSITDASPHALCARGHSRVRVRRSRICRAYDRAIYCYHSSSLEVADSVISGTRSKATAAVQIDALRPGDAATLTIARTIFESNAGGDLSVSGNVARSIGAEVRVVERQAEQFGLASASVRDASGELQGM